MITLVYIFFIVFGIQYVLVMLLGISYRKKSTSKDPSDLQVSVIVPFRNEEERIVGLLESINGLVRNDSLEVEFIFVDDGSKDRTAALIESTLKCEHQVIENNETGKKKAIRTGIYASKFPLILTWDADIEVPSKYFNELSKLPECDMYILPVNMKGDKFLSRLVALDFSWLQMISYVLANRGTPFLNNGANLMFKKEAFLAAEKERTDYKIASGDDVYLLQKFSEQSKVIRAFRSRSLQVVTAAPNTMRKVINQRRRWASKVKDMQDGKSIILSIILFIMVFGSLGCLFWTISSLNPIFLTPLILKVFNEYILLRFYKGSKELAVDFVVVICHQLFFPIYMMTVGLKPIKNDARWDH